MLLPNKIRILICTQKIDFRRSIDGLSILVADLFKQNPISDYLFVFRNNYGDRVKVLYWDRNGFVLWYKRLEKGRFKLPPLKDGCFELNLQQLRWLLEGLDFMKIKGHEALHYEKHY